MRLFLPLRLESGPWRSGAIKIPLRTEAQISGVQKHEAFPHVVTGPFDPDMDRLVVTPIQQDCRDYRARRGPKAIAKCHDFCVIAIAL